MIIRQWQALAKPEQEAAYLAHFRQEVLPKLHLLGGFLGATLLRREQEDGIQLTVLTRWENMDAVRAFAGANPGQAVVATNAKPCFHTYDLFVSHHEVAFEENLRPPRAARS